jgi:FkbM family methyltransferase
VFRALSQKASRDPRWTVINSALGDFDGTAAIHVSANNSLSSSLLPMAQRHLDAAPDSRVVAHERISVARLDSVFGSLGADRAHILLKIDVQGFERRVIDGAGCCLTRIDTLQLELSTVSLYEGDNSFTDMCSLLRARGYDPVAFEPAFFDPDRAQMLQFDGIFHRFAGHALASRN